jgi:hypothetical protein
MLALASAQSHPAPIRGAGGTENPRRLGKQNDAGKKNGKNGKNGGGGAADGVAQVRSDGATISAFGVIEERGCIPEGQIQSHISGDARSDPDCAAGGVALTRGCCRIFLFLELDEDNDLPHLQCMCGPTTFDATTSDQGPIIDVGNGNGNGNGNENDNGDVDGTGTGTGTETGTANGNDGDQGQGGDDRDGGTGGESVDVCAGATYFQGRGWGAMPSDSSIVPDDLTPGDCRSSAHCGVPLDGDVCCKYKNKASVLESR